MTGSSFVLDIVCFALRMEFLGLAIFLLYFEYHLCFLAF
jgi:hypothetical protein